MKKLYHLYNEDFQITHAEFFIEGEQPENAIFIEVMNFIKPMLNPLTLEVYEGATVSEISELSKSNETQAYLKRITDGQKAYAEISAEFRLAKLNNTITEESHAYIERLLIPVRNEVLAGQWISAKKELELIGQDAVGVDLYNRLYIQISSYITENY